MKNGYGPNNCSPRTRLRDKFLARYMATQTKHSKVTRRKKTQSVPRLHSAAAPKPPALPPARPPIKEERSPKDEDLVRDDEEPKPEDLAKEEAELKAVEAEERAPVAEPETAERIPEPRARDRSA